MHVYVLLLKYNVLKTSKSKNIRWWRWGEQKFKIIYDRFLVFPDLSRVYFIKFTDYSWIETEELKLTIYVLDYTHNLQNIIGLKNKTS